MRKNVISALLLSLLLSACAGETPAPEPRKNRTPKEGALRSVEILDREPITDRAEVRHVLIGWDELEAGYGDRLDERAKARTRADANLLAGEILQRARAGEDFIELMKDHSEDWTSAESGKSFTATPDAALVPPFRKLALRLEPGEVGLVKSAYGWHVIKRFE